MAPIRHDPTAIDVFGPRTDERAAAPGRNSQRGTTRDLSPRHCDTVIERRYPMKPKVTTVSIVAGLALLTLGCSESPNRSADTAPTTGAPPTSTSTVSVTTTVSPVSWVMPNLVGQNLQAAQDAIQALTTDFVFFTSSTDATGQDRPQVLDSNWKVCSQSIPPGDTISTTTKIEFAAVKLTEQCP
jgi:hypothetical protein